MLEGEEPSELKHAIDAEQERFRQFYLWLKQAMPSLFFQQISQEWVTVLVHALMSFKLQGSNSQIHFQRAALSLCIDSPQADEHILQHYAFYGIQTYTTYISTLPFPEELWHLRIALIKFTAIGHKEEQILLPAEQDELLSHLQQRHPHASKEEWKHLLEQCDLNFLYQLPIMQQVFALEMFRRSETRDACQYILHKEDHWYQLQKPSMHVVMGWKNVTKHNFLYRLACIVHQHGLTMHHVHATYLRPHQKNSILLLSFGLHGIQGKAAWEEGDVDDLLQELVMLKYFGSDDLINKVFVRSGKLTGNLANLLRTMVIFVHQVLVHADANLYDFDNLLEGFCCHPDLTCQIMQLFSYRFHPTQHNSEHYQKLHQQLLELINKLDTGQAEQDERRKHILLQGINFVHFTLKTNFYRHNKTALAFRLDPHYLDHAPFERKKLFPQLPFGIFFIKGMHFFGFHIRFKDLARGGLRTVCPDKKERVLAEQDTVFSECYQLAYTQNKKNKDIPEGGAKAIIFLKPFHELNLEAQIYEKELQTLNLSTQEIEHRLHEFITQQQQEYLYQTQRSFIKNLLALVNCEPDGQLRAKHIIDYWGKPEYLYLGPDENMHDMMIEWIAQESRKEHYKPAGAFISGKPSVGFNHKEFGVTSLGVHVYLQEVLNFLKIDALHTPFTVKMSGGPDGDVAGNEIINLHRSFPHTAKLVALTDVSGTIHDPQGLDLALLVNLCHQSLSIRHYPPEKISAGGFLLDKATKQDSSAYVQQTLCWKMHDNGHLEKSWLSGNEMHALFRHNVHATPADVFIPCGGRPRTLCKHNYQEFLTSTGQPTAKAIIEGANLYLSDEARHLLEKKGVLIIKDSSANKCGVICSSFEILCSLVLKDQEFLEHKTTLIQDILQRLQKFAYLEAHLLLSTHQNTGQPLTELSELISERINLFTDQLMGYLDTQQLSQDPHDPFIQCYLAFCPLLLRTHFQNRLLQDVPDHHKKAIIAAHLASRLVYTRGLTWFPTLVDILPVILEDQRLLEF